MPEFAQLPRKVMSYEEEISKAVTEALEEILAKKHLYQAVRLPFDIAKLRKTIGRPDFSTGG